MGIGAVMNFTPIDPIKALFWSAVINGVVAVPVMAMMMLLAVRRAVMGKFVLPRSLQVIGWIATAVTGLWFSRWPSRRLPESSHFYCGAPERSRTAAKPVRQLAYLGRQPRSRFALAFEPARISVIMIVMCSPARSLPSSHPRPR